MRPPLDGLRILDVSQYVAGPLATMLLADLGADVIKVEPPHGDAWRHYAPHAANESTYFYSLNRNKRSVVLDLKTEVGRAAMRRLLSTTDAVVHNLPAERAHAFALDRDSVREANPHAVWVCVSAFGSSGPESDRPAYDLIAQAASGLLMADVHVGDDVPRRSGGIPTADIISGLLACVSVLAGLRQRSEDAAAAGFEVSLLGAALAAQIQGFVRLTEVAPDVARAPINRADLDERAGAIAAAEALDPYYRCYATADGFLALACLNLTQRRQVLDLLDLTDPWVDNPQQAPRDDAERAVRARTSRLVAESISTRPTAEWVALLAARNVPAGAVRALDQLLDDEQVHANGLVQTVHQPEVGRVQLLGNLFKVDGTSAAARRAAPALGEHTDEVLSELDVLCEALERDSRAVTTHGGDEA